MVASTLDSKSVMVSVASVDRAEASVTTAEADVTSIIIGFFFFVVIMVQRYQFTPIQFSKVVKRRELVAMMIHYRSCYMVLIPGVIAPINPRNKHTNKSIFPFLFDRDYKGYCPMELFALWHQLIYFETMIILRGASW